MSLRIRTILIQGNDRWEPNSPCVYPDGEYPSVDALRTELRRRWRERQTAEIVTDIPGGLRFETPSQIQEVTQPD